MPSAAREPRWARLIVASSPLIESDGHPFAKFILSPGVISIRLSNLKLILESGREGADSRLDLPAFRSMSDIPEIPKISAT